MGKQIVVRTRKALGILLSVLFVMSITAATASANIDISKYGPHDKINYKDGYNNGFHDGSKAGYADGMKNGYNDCQKGLDNDSENGGTNNLVFKCGAAYDIGYADGYNNGYRQGYIAAYKAGYNGCHRRNYSIQTFTNK